MELHRLNIEGLSVQTDGRVELDDEQLKLLIDSTESAAGGATTYNVTSCDGTANRNCNNGLFCDSSRNGICQNTESCKNTGKFESTEE